MKTLENFLRHKACAKTILISLINGILLTSNVVFGQTQTQIQQIQSRSNINVLNQLAARFDSTYNQQRILAEQWAIDNGLRVSGKLPDGSYMEIQGFENGRPYYYVTYNLNAAKTVSTNKVWPGGCSSYNLDGSGYTMGVWDALKPADHPEFTGRWTPQFGIPNSFTSHFTHVVGTMIASGIDTDAKGMAPAANVYTFSMSNDLNSMVIAQTNWGLLLSNHSYGPFAGWVFGKWVDFFTGEPFWSWEGDRTISQTEDYKFGFYSDLAQSLDVIANNAPYYLIVQAAGNDRGFGPPPGTGHISDVPTCCDNGWTVRDLDGGEDGYDCLPDRVVAKNILTVGAINDIPNGYEGPCTIEMAIFSNWGPTDDGRIKPDIVANGIDVYSTCSLSGYCEKSGTSMAAPNVTGSLALLHQHYSNTHGGDLMVASTLKALVIHTADEAGLYDGPDYSSGWGVLNTEKAANVISQDDTSAQTIQELSIAAGQTQTFTVFFDGTQDFIKGTIVWNDPAGTPTTPQLNPDTSMLVNDLDLRIIRQSDGEVFFPWTLDRDNPSDPAVYDKDNFRDNVEQVYIRAPQAGNYIISISRKSLPPPPKGQLILLDFQNYSLIITGDNSAPLCISNPTFDYPNGLIIPAGTILNWTGLISFKGEVIIDSGAVLNIDSAEIKAGYNEIIQAGFPYQRARIIIEPGGKLTGNKSTFTGCSGEWDGIEVRGDETADQIDAEQGVLELDSCTIKNARMGIFCGIRSLINVTFKPSSGGIVRITNTDFINNFKAVKMNNYPDFERTSFFTNCKFQYNDSTLFTYSVFQNMIFVEFIDTWGVTFTDNTFITDDSAFPIDKRGIAIKGRSAGFNVFGNLFQGLTIGIESGLYNPTARKIVVDSNTFDNIQRNIYIQGGYLDEIRNNTFFIPEAITDDTYGIFLVSSSGFLIEGNHFDGFQGPPSCFYAAPFNYCIVVENSGPVGGIIFNNTSQSTDFGIQTQGDNQNLKIRCNLFHVNSSIHTVTAWACIDGSLKQQGANCGDDKSPAGNEWVSGGGCVIDVWTDSVLFVYYAHQNNIAGQNYTIPLSSSTFWKDNYVMPNVCWGLNKTDSSCLSSIPGLLPPPPVTDTSVYIAAIKDLISQYELDILDLENEIIFIDSITDGGNTQLLMDVITGVTPLPNGQLKDLLLASQPLSDDVLIALINKVPPLPPGILKEILELSSPLSLVVMAELNSLSPPLPKGIMNDIEDAQSNEPLFPKVEDLKKQIVFLEGEIQLLENELRRYLPDKIISRDVLVESRTLESKKLLAEEFLAENQTVLCRHILDSLSQDTIIHQAEENQNFCKLMFILVDLAEDQKTIIDLDSAQKMQVRQVANAKNIISAKAEVILDIVDNEKYFHPIKKFQISGPNSRIASPNENTNEGNNVKEKAENQSQLMQNIPNPFSDQTIIQYNLPAAAQNAKIEIYDPIGRKLRSYQLNNQTGKIIINGAELKNGIYFYTLNIDAQTILYKKMVVNK